MIDCVETPKNQLKSLVNNKWEFKVTGYKVDMQKLINSPIYQQWKLDLKFKNTICSKTKILNDKCNKICARSICRKL